MGFNWCKGISRELWWFLVYEVSWEGGAPFVVKLFSTRKTIKTIESTFSTIRLRTKKTRACVSRTTILTMVYKLGLSAEKGWRKLRGFRRLADVINGVKFIDGIDEETIERQRNAAWSCPHTPHLTITLFFLTGINLWIGFVARLIFLF